MESKYQAVGIIGLTRVTPVIRALFGAYNLAPNNVRSAYIAIDADASHTVQDLCDNLSQVFNLPDAENPREALLAVAERLSVADRSLIGNLSDEWEADGNDMDNIDTDLTDLFHLAQALDDGHGAEYLWLEGAYTSSKLRSDEFGGDGTFVSKAFTRYAASSDVLALSNIAVCSIKNNDIEALVDQADRLVTHFLGNIQDDAVRVRVQQAIDRRQSVHTASNEMLKKALKEMVACGLETEFMDELERYIETSVPAVPSREEVAAPAP